MSTQSATDHAPRAVEFFYSEKWNALFVTGQQPKDHEGPAVCVEMIALPETASSTGMRGLGVLFNALSSVIRDPAAGPVTIRALDDDCGIDVSETACGYTVRDRVTGSYSYFKR